MPQQNKSDKSLSQILILDEFTTKLLSSCCKMSDLMAEKITSEREFIIMTKKKILLTHEELE